MNIRTETSADVAGIRVVEEAAFPTRSEAELVDRLRADGDAVLSLMAVLENEIVGHVMFSRMRTPARTLGLGPAAVLTRHRRKGIAADLIRDSLTRAGEEGWTGIFVLENPAYYGRFGFEPSLAARSISPHAGPNLMALALQSDGLPLREETLEYAAAFAAVG